MRYKLVIEMDLDYPTEVSETVVREQTKKSLEKLGGANVFVEVIGTGEEEEEG